MRNDKHLVLQLRKRGKSYNAISKELGIPKSTLSGWLKNNPWSEQIKQGLIEKNRALIGKKIRIMNKARKKKLETWYKQCRQQAEKEFPQLKSNPLFLAGLMLYWGEGDSKIENCMIRLSNTDPEMIKIFSSFLQKICQISKEKIRIHIILYPDLNDEICKNFWSKISGIPQAQFIKTSFIQGKHPTRRLTNGICIIYVASRELKEKIFTWIKLYQQEFKRV
ncbi:MAG: hypothetical protein KY055_01635 [Candidatus Nealsonbacteria bacterium]|nr:hypothetical protein [Candidatus Nealsonbacteria bacterium]